MKHNFTFKDGDNFGHIIYNIAQKFERGGNFIKKKGYYSIYVECSQEQMKALMKRCVVYKIKSFKESIVTKQKEVSELKNELDKFLTVDWIKKIKKL